MLVEPFVEAFSHRSTHVHSLSATELRAARESLLKPCRVHSLPTQDACDEPKCRVEIRVAR